jgi:uncharacterized protein involved in exopolysaccharide biosynthesis
MNEHSEVHDDEYEMNLYELYLSIKKRRLLILVIFLVSVAVTAAVSYKMSSVYRVSAIIIPGWLEMTENGIVHVDSAGNIMSAINSGAFNNVIIKNLRLEPVGFYHEELSGIKAGVEGKAQLIRIAYDTKDPLLGEKILRELLKQLEVQYKDRVGSRNEAIDGQIQVLNNMEQVIKGDEARILNVKKKFLQEINMQDEKLKVLKERESALFKKVDEVENNTKLIVEQRTRLMNTLDGKVDVIPLLLYSNNIQENIKFAENLSARLDDIRLRSMDTERRINEVKIMIKDKDSDLRDQETKRLNSNQERINMQNNKKMIEGVRVMQAPSKNPNPVKPRKMLNIAVAGITSLFLGGVLSLFLEWFRKNRLAVESYVAHKDSN